MVQKQGTATVPANPKYDNRLLVLISSPLIIFSILVFVVLVTFLIAEMKYLTLISKSIKVYLAHSL